MARSVPGKYDALLPRLSKLPPEDPSRQEQIDKLKASVPTREAPSLAERYILLRAMKDEAAAKLSLIQLQIDAYEQMLAESQEAGSEGWGAYGVKDNALRLPSGDTVRVQPEPYGKVIDKEAFRLWCIKNGYETQLQLWPSRMNAIVKERLLQGEAHPDGCEAYVSTKVVLVKKGSE